MITEVVIQGVAPGKTRQAVEWGSKVVAYFKKAGLPQVSILRPITGETSDVVFMVQWPSMSEFEEAYRKRRADSDWQTMVKELIESDWNLGTERIIYDVVE